MDIHDERPDHDPDDGRHPGPADDLTERPGSTSDPPPDNCGTRSDARVPAEEPDLPLPELPFTPPWEMLLAPLRKVRQWLAEPADETIEVPNFQFGHALAFGFLFVPVLWLYANAPWPGGHETPFSATLSPAQRGLMAGQWLVDVCTGCLSLLVLAVVLRAWWRQPARLPQPGFWLAVFHAMPFVVNLSCLLGWAIDPDLTSVFIISLVYRLGRLHSAETLLILWLLAVWCTRNWRVWQIGFAVLAVLFLVWLLPSYAPLGRFALGPVHDVLYQLVPFGPLLVVVAGEVSDWYARQRRDWTHWAAVAIVAADCALQLSKRLIVLSPLSV
ncbi:MAG: hypothetical protein ACOY3P_15660 [Planctomycetota bacterium]